VLPPEPARSLHTPETLQKALRGLLLLGAIPVALAGFGFDPDAVTPEMWRELCTERAARLANRYGEQLAEWSEFYAKWEDEIWFAGESIAVLTTMGKAVYKSMRELKAQALQEAEQRKAAQAELHRVDQDQRPPAPAPGAAPAPAKPAPSAPTTTTPAPASPESSGISVRPEPARPFTPSGLWDMPTAPSSSTPRGT
jgi:hypothetical protein